MQLVFQSVDRLLRLSELLGIHTSDMRLSGRFQLFFLSLVRFQHLPRHVDVILQALPLLRAVLYAHSPHFFLPVQQLFERVTSLIDVLFQPLIILCLKPRLSELFQACPEIFNGPLCTCRFLIEFAQRLFIAADGFLCERAHAVDVFSELADVFTQISDRALSITECPVHVLRFYLYAFYRALCLTHFSVSTLCGFPVIGKGGLQYFSELIDFLCQRPDGIQELLRALLKAFIIQTGINRNRTVGTIRCHKITSFITSLSTE